MTSHRNCPICGGISKPVVEAREIKVGRWMATVDDEFMRCESCGDEAYLPGQMKATHDRAAHVIREREKLVSPERVRAIRERYGITQSQLERLLGVGPKTVVRWERGSVIPSAAMNTLLKILESTPVIVAGLAMDTGVRISGGFEPSAIPVDDFASVTWKFEMVPWPSPALPVEPILQPGEALPAAIELRLRNRQTCTVGFDGFREALA